MIEYIIPVIVGWLLSWFFPCKQFLTKMYKKLVGIKQHRMVNTEKKDNEMKRIIKESGESLKIKEFENFVEIPEKGIEKEKLLGMIEERSTYDSKRIADKHISGSFYVGSQERLEVISEATKQFSLSNPLHADNCPSVRKMEAEVIKMTANMLHGDDEVRGMMTTGGSESIILAVRGHYQNAIKNRGFPSDQCEIIMSVNAHPSWLKGCEMMGIKPVMIPLDKRNALDIDLLQKSITRYTCLVVTSAPSYPHGVIDEIEKVCVICKARRIPVHVDACLGGFVNAWATEAGFNVPKFDFQVDGVMSISCDTHKYGYAPKGSSVLLFKNEQLRNIVFFCFPTWLGGVYCSPSIPGSRAGCYIAGAWVSLLYTGKQGYIDATRKILTTSKVIKTELAKMDNIQILNDMEQDTSVVAFRTKDVNIYKISDCMQKEFNWELNALQSPDAVHLCITEKTAGCEKKFLEDFKKAYEMVKKDPENPKYNATAPIYGMTTSTTDNELIEEAICQYIANFCDVI